MEYVIAVTAAGTAGSATGTGYSECAVRGFLEYISYSYAGAPNTTTITVTEEDTNRAVLSVSAGNTDGLAYVRAAAVNTANSAISGSWPRLYFQAHRLKVVVASSDNAAVITLRVQVSGEMVE